MTTASTKPDLFPFVWYDNRYTIVMPDPRCGLVARADTAGDWPAKRPLRDIRAIYRDTLKTYVMLGKRYGCHSRKNVSFRRIKLGPKRRAMP